MKRHEVPDRINASERVTPPLPAEPVCGGPAFYKRVFSYFAEDRHLLVLLVLFIWVALGLGVLAPKVVGWLYDLVGGWGGGGGANQPVFRLLPASRVGQIVSLAVGWVIVSALNDGLVTLVREMLNNQIRYNGTARVRSQLFDHYQTLTPAYHKTHPQGDAIYRLNIDTQGFFGVLNTFVGAANSVITLLVLTLVMAGVNVRITVVALCLTPLMMMANSYFGRTIRRTAAVSKQADSDLTTFVQRAMGAITVVQLFGRERAQSVRLRESIDNTIRAGMRMNWQEQLYPLVQKLIYALGYGFVLGYGGYLAFRSQQAASPGESALTVGGIITMTMYLSQLWEPLKRITGFSADVQTNAAACARVFDVLDLPPTVGDSPDAGPLPLRRRVLELEGVRFSYDIDRPAVLRGISARVEPGEMVAFVGASGAGKSTLLNLLPRFYDPTEGSLMLDGHDLRDVQLADVRRHIALVPQDSAVMSGTIAENIAFGNLNATPQAIREAAKRSGAATFIEEMPDRYETMVTEGGQNLSGGQRQRIAIARALLTGAPILVLDEPTSGLDRAHERRVLQTLKSLRGDRTVIVVTHSLTAAAECDHIYYLHQGLVAEEGTHEELLDRGGLYAALAAMPHMPDVDIDADTDAGEDDEDREMPAA